MRRTEKRKSAPAPSALPMAADEVWEGGWAALAAAVRSDDGEEPYHPELVMWVVAGEGFVLGDTLVGPGGGKHFWPSIPQRCH